MYSKIQPPTKKISKESVKVWRMTEAITPISLSSPSLASYYLLMIISLGKNGLDGFLNGLIVLSFFHAIWSIFIEPILLQKYWR